MTILVTGGTGYIGSHTCLELLSSGFDVVIVDNFSNSKPAVLERLMKISGRSIPFVELDICNRKDLETVFDDYKVDAVIHFAGLKAVGESCEKPVSYYQNNVAGTLTLCEVMAKKNVRNIIFSSSATVYGDPATVPITESFPTGATNPYGRSKLMVEEILRDLSSIPGSDWKISILRYFNPIGAHKSGQIGEDPQGIPNNLLPYVAQVATGRRDKLRIFGGDYPTVDGTGVRDYIHVVDLAQGHIQALRKLYQATPGCYIYNLGTGNGYSVLQVVNAFQDICPHPIPYEIVERRAGDIAECFADASLARKELNWKAEFSLKQMVEDTWRWQSNNPTGYDQ